MKHIYTVALLAILSITSLRAQDNMVLTAKNLPQAMLINPALAPERGFMSIPLVGSVDINFNNSFSLNDVITRQNGTNYLNNSGIINALSGNRNLTMIRMNLDLANVGFRISDKIYGGVSLRSRVHVASDLPGGLFELLVENPYDRYTTFNMAMSPNLVGWNELGISATYRINDNWRVGARLKYLMGVASVESGVINFDMDKQFDRYTLSGDVNIRGGNINFDGNNNDMVEGLFGNSGFGADIGVQYTSDDKKWSANASVSDLGTISWNAKNSSKIVTRNPNTKFEFMGFGDLQNFAANSDDMGQLLDSVYQKFTRTIGVDTTSGVGFSSSLPTTIQAMGSYAIDPKFRHNVSLGFIGTFPNAERFHYAISAGYNYRTVNGMWELMTNYTYKSNNPLNIGLGVVFLANKFQLFLASDNVISYFSMANARSANAKLGITVFFANRSRGYSRY